MTKIWGYIFAAIFIVVAACSSDVADAHSERDPSGTIEIIRVPDSTESSSSAFSRSTRTNLYFSNHVEVLSSSSIAPSSSSKTPASSSSSKPAPKSSSSEAKSSSSEPPKSSSSSAPPSSSSTPKSSASLNFYNCEDYNCVTTEYLNPDISYGEFLDKRDNQVYRTLVISNHVWTAQNMNYEIESEENDEINSWCYDNEPENCKKFGRLYTWEAAKKVCPEGWHLPTKDEWLELFTEHSCEIEKDDTNSIIYRCAGTSLKAIDSWDYDTDNTNEYGFSVVAAGLMTSGKFKNKGVSSYLWTATAPYEIIATLVTFEYNEDFTRFVLINRNVGLPVRCVKGAAE